MATKQVTIALAWRNWEKELLFSEFQIRGEKFISSRWHTMKGSSLNFCSVFFLLYMILMLFYFHWSFHLWIMIFCWCFPTSNWKYFLLEFRVWDFFKKFKLKNIEDKRTLLTRYIHICLDQSYFKKKKFTYTSLLNIFQFHFIFFSWKATGIGFKEEKVFNSSYLNVCMVLPNHTMIVTLHRVLYFRALDIASKEHVYVL